MSSSFSYKHACVERSCVKIKYIYGQNSALGKEECIRIIIIYQKAYFAQAYEFFIWDTKPNKEILNITYFQCFNGHFCPLKSFMYHWLYKIRGVMMKLNILYIYLYMSHISYYHSLNKTSGAILKLDILYAFLFCCFVYALGPLLKVINAVLIALT